MARLG
ncbi:unnamed protein product, partial [Rotaria sp. Silwood1]